MLCYVDDGDERCAGSGEGGVWAAGELCSEGWGGEGFWRVVLCGLKHPWRSIPFPCDTWLRISCPYRYSLRALVGAPPTPSPSNPSTPLLSRTPPINSHFTTFPPFSSQNALLFIPPHLRLPSPILSSHFQFPPPPAPFSILLLPPPSSSNPTLTLITSPSHYRVSIPKTPHLSRAVSTVKRILKTRNKILWF